MIKDFTEMPVWQKAMQVAVDCYKITASLPIKEDYALTSQLRRSAGSISANIAEGFGRRTNKDKCRFYDIARGSAFETKNHLIYGVKVEYFDKKQVAEIYNMLSEIVYELNKIIHHFYSKPQSQP